MCSSRSTLTPLRLTSTSACSRTRLSRLSDAPCRLPSEAASRKRPAEALHPQEALREVLRQGAEQVVLPELAAMAAQRTQLLGRERPDVDRGGVGEVIAAEAVRIEAPQVGGQPPPAHLLDQ